MKTAALATRAERTERPIKTPTQAMAKPNFLKKFDYYLDKFSNFYFETLLLLLYKKKEKDISKDYLKNIFDKIIETEKINFKDLGQPLRIILTGSEYGPAIYDIASSLGLNEFLNRLELFFSKIASDTYYTNEGRYDWVPIQYQNTPSTNSSTPWYGQIPFQSSQMKGQYVYSRYKNIANDDELYSSSVIDASAFDGSGIDDYEYGLTYTINYGAGNTPTINNNRNYNNSTNAPFATTTNANDFIWAGSYTSLTPNTTALDAGVNTPTSSQYDNGIFLHKSHPLINQTVLANVMSITDLQSAGVIGMPKTATRRVNMDSISLSILLAKQKDH